MVQIVHLFIFGMTRTKFVSPRRPLQVFCSVTTCIKSCTIFQGISLHKEYNNDEHETGNQKYRPFDRRRTSCLSAYPRWKLCVSKKCTKHNVIHIITSSSDLRSRSKQVAKLKLVL